MPYLLIQIKSIVPEHKSAAEMERTYDDPDRLESLESLIPLFLTDHENNGVN